MFKKKRNKKTAINLLTNNYDLFFNDIYKLYEKQDIKSIDDIFMYININVIELTKIIEIFKYIDDNIKNCNINIIERLLTKKHKTLFNISNLISKLTNIELKSNIISLYKRNILDVYIHLYKNRLDVIKYHYNKFGIQTNIYAPYTPIIYDDNIIYVLYNELKLSIDEIMYLTNHFSYKNDYIYTILINNKSEYFNCNKLYISQLTNQLNLYQYYKLFNGHKLYSKYINNINDYNINGLSDNEILDIVKTIIDNIKNNKTKLYYKWSLINQMKLTDNKLIKNIINDDDIIKLLKMNTSIIYNNYILNYVNNDILFDFNYVNRLIIRKFKMSTHIMNIINKLEFINIDLEWYNTILYLSKYISDLDFVKLLNITNLSYTDKQILLYNLYYDKR